MATFHKITFSFKTDSSNGPTLQDHVHDEEQEESKLCPDNPLLEDSTEAELKEEQRTKMLPPWMLYPTIFLNASCILTCSFFIVWYGMAFGNTRSWEWLTSVTFGLVCSF